MVDFAHEPYRRTRRSRRAQGPLAAAEAALAERDAALAELADANRRLEQMIDALRREKFGPSSEKPSPYQWNLTLEDVEIAQGILEAAQEKADATRRAPPRSAGQAGSQAPAAQPAGDRAGDRADLDALPLRLQRDDPDRRRRRAPARRDPGPVPGARHPPAEIRLLALRGCGRAGPRVRARGPGGLPTEALIARIIVSKFAEHLPVLVIGRVWSMAMTVRRAGPCFRPWSARRRKMRTVEVGMLRSSTSATPQTWADPG